nr:hypothetical protein SHINE37_110221 [Rhizobiaceae bacterium]
MVKPGARRDAVAYVCEEHDVSQRRACAILAVDRSTTAVSATSASTKRCSRHCLTPEPKSPHGRRITTDSDLIQRWATSRPTNSP